MAKQKKISFPRKKFGTTKNLELVHTDLSGPLRTRGFYGERYFMILVDDFTRMMWVAFLKEKLEAFEKFKIFNNRVENESGVKIKSLRSDRGGEFTPREFNIYYEEHGIKRQLSSPHSLSKIELLKEEIDKLLKQQELCYLRVMYQFFFGEKQ